LAGFSCVPHAAETVSIRYLGYNVRENLSGGISWFTFLTADIGAKSGNDCTRQFTEAMSRSERRPTNIQE
jgi:hypothetical protein